MTDRDLDVTFDSEVSFGSLIMLIRRCFFYISDVSRVVRTSCHTRSV